jgi:hypothetical protein
MPQAGKFLGIRCGKAGGSRIHGRIRTGQGIVQSLRRDREFYANSWSEGALAASILAVESPDHPQTEYMKSGCFTGKRTSGNDPHKRN